MYSNKGKSRRHFYRRVKSYVDKSLLNVTGNASTESRSDDISKKPSLLVVAEVGTKGVQENTAELPLTEPLDFNEHCNTSYQALFPLPHNVNLDLDHNNSTSKCLDILSFMDKVKIWAVKQKVPHTTLNELLLIMREEEALKKYNIPKDARSLLGTQRSVIVRQVPPGTYCHLGIEYSINKLINYYPFSSINIAVNIDGLPISKSSGSQLYPILCLILDINRGNNIVLVGLYHGNQKPNDFNYFLKDFVQECVMLLQNGINISGRICKFNLKFLLFDAVAKSSVLNVKGHSGYSSCTKCSQEGEYILDRICFPNLNCTKRTNEDFRKKVDENHHIGDTILTDIPNLDLIDDIPLDYMHLVCLGVVKKFITNTWTFGRPPHKLPFSEIQLTTKLSNDFGPYIPSEFVRRPRSFVESKRWKATEFRMFLLYTSPIITKLLSLSKKKYEHFLALHVAITILVCPSFCRLYNYAHELLVYYVSKTKDIYGEHYLTHNMHNLLHIVDDVRRFGPLDTFSNFSSENFLHKLKCLIRKGDKPLEQIIKRISEGALYSTNSASGSNVDIDFQLEQCVLNNFNVSQYKQAVFPTYILNTHKRNNCCGLIDGSIVIVICFAVVNNERVLVGRKYLFVSDFYLHPCKSSLLGIHFVKQLNNLNQTFSIKDVVKKYIRLPFSDGFVVFPLLHSV